MANIQKIFTSYQPDIDGNTYIGQRGRIWFDEDLKQFRFSDGSTVGGIAITSSTSNGVPLYIQDTQPTATGPYQWIQTNYGGIPGNFTVWFNDGV